MSLIKKQSSLRNSMRALESRFVFDGALAGQINSAPTAENVWSTMADGIASGKVLGKDVNGDALSYGVISQPKTGWVEFKADGSYTYHANPGSTAKDTFTYAAYDGVQGHVSNIATVTIDGKSVTSTATTSVASTLPVTNSLDTSKNVAPTAESVWNSTIAGVSVGKVIGKDLDGDKISFGLLTQPKNGWVEFKADGSYTYHAKPGYIGNDSFTVAAYDGVNGHVSTPATVSIVVKDSSTSGSTAGNVAPVSKDSSSVLNASTKLATGKVTATDANVADKITFGLITQPKNGWVEFKADGSYIYHASPGFTGTDSFTFSAYDGVDGHKSVASKVTVTGTAIPAFGSTAGNVAPVSKDSSSVLNASTKLATGKVTATDANVADKITFGLITQPKNGWVEFKADGSYIYHASPGFTGTDSFTFSAYDGVDGHKSVASKVTVTGTAIPAIGTTAGNVAPVSYAATSKVVSGLATGKVTATDVNTADKISFGLVTQPKKGWIEFKADGNYIYHAYTGQTGTDTFTFSAYDGVDGHKSTPSTVTVTL